MTGWAGREEAANSPPRMRSNETCSGAQQSLGERPLHTIELQQHLASTEAVRYGIGRRKVGVKRVKTFGVSGAQRQACWILVETRSGLA